jgi:aspartyl-tRNA(Asn)/glutamyl-tRNA(Gln) amidotransferase subunit A
MVRAKFRNVSDSNKVLGMRSTEVGRTETSDTAELYALSRSLGLGKEVQKRILLGTYSLTAE